MKQIFFRLIILVLIFFSIESFALSQCDSKCGDCNNPTCNTQSDTSNINSNINDIKNNESKNESNDILEVDEFEEFEEFEESDTGSVSTIEIKHRLKFPFFTLIFTLIAGIFVRHKILRNYRKVFLFFTLIFFGFSGYYAGPCICPVGNFQNLVIFDGNIINYLLYTASILILIPLTYFFGKVWCGWVCHLGGLQEFLYTKNKIKILKGEKAQKIMKITRIILVLVILIHAAVNQDRTFCNIDPFKAIFSFEFGSTLVIVLSVVIILLSLFIYRPFCRSVCPIGILLGLVSKIPFAYKVRYIENAEHISCCKTCVNMCFMQAITEDENNTKNTIDTKKKIDDFNCITCGECFSKCKTKGIKLTSKNK